MYDPIKDGELVGALTQQGEVRHAYNYLFVNHELMKPPGRPRRRLEVSVKCIL
jgi:hypothetical protein